MKKFSSFLMASLLLLAVASCTTYSNEVPNTDKDVEENLVFTNFVDIQFNGDQVSINNLCGAPVQIQDLPNEVKINSELDLVEYHISGNANGKAVRIYSLHKCKVVIKDLTLNSGQQPAINIQTKKRCYLVVEGNNFLADEFGYPTNNNTPVVRDSTLDGEDKKGTFFAEGQVIMSGTGNLTIEGNNKHAFATEQYLRIRSGQLNIKNAVSCGIRAKEYFWLEDGKVTMDKILGKGIKVSEGYITIGGGQLNINTLNDGIVASYGSNPTDAPIVPEPCCDIQIHAGDINIHLLKEANAKKAYAFRTFKGTILLQGGKIDITKYPEAVDFIGPVQQGNTQVTIHNL